MSTLIVTHGNLAQEFLEAARTITGRPLEDMRALALDWGAEREEIHRILEGTLAEMDNPEGVLILTDLYGGTPCNVALQLLRPHRVEVVAGVNLPMVLRLACPRREDMDLEEIAQWVLDKGHQSLLRASAPVGSDGEPVPSKVNPC